jgi:cell wall-associated NlpC family hydrolase
MSFNRLGPDPADLQTGDLVWPRADRQIVTFDTDPSQDLPWMRAYAALRDAPTALSSEQSEQLELFVRDFWVGHVALIEVVDGIPWVVDATPSRSGWAQPRTDGVAMQPYQAFLDDAAHTESHIWHGRVSGQSPDAGRRLIEATKKYLGAKYDLRPWGFDRADDFYCSKLIWHALRDGLGITLDKKGPRVPQPWFTPWDVMQASGITLLYEPAGKSYRG